MAVTFEKSFSRCQVRLQNGVDGQGEPVYVNRVFGRIRPDAAHQDVYDVMSAVMALQELPVVTIRRIDDGELINR